MKVLPWVLLGLYLAVVGLCSFFINVRNEETKDYRATRPLAHNHRIVSSDLQAPELALEGLGRGIPDPDAFIGKYVISAMKNRDTVLRTNLALVPDLVTQPGHVLYWHSLRDEAAGLATMLDAGQSVDLCSTHGVCVGNVSVAAVTCANPPSPCQVALEVPIGSREGLLRAAGDKSLAVFPESGERQPLTSSTLRRKR